MTSVNCTECRELLGPYLDDASSDEVRRIVDAHLGKCPACRQEHDALIALRARLKAAGPHPMPPHLAGRLADALDAEYAREIKPRWQARSYAALAASHIVIAALAAAIAMQMGWSMRGRDEMLRQAVDAQVRATLTEQVVQVASSDRHTVKPWLANKLTYSPVVRDFKDEGFPLLGARVEMLGSNPVAALIYGRREHRIAVFVAPSGQLPAVASMSASEHGYNAIGWHDGAFDHLAVSDLNQGELHTFIGLAQHAKGD